MHFSGWFDSTANKVNGVAEYREWKLKKMGQFAFDLLTVRAHRAARKDDVATLMWLKEVMKELDE